MRFFYFVKLKIAFSSHELSMTEKGDTVADGRWLFEVGGKRKGFSHIKDIESSFVVADNMEIGHGNKIPMWVFWVAVLM